MEQYINMGLNGLAMLLLLLSVLSASTWEMISWAAQGLQLWR